MTSALISSAIAVLTGSLWARTSGVTDLDDLISARFEQSHVPGGAFALLRQGKLIHVRGFGYADPDREEMFLPTTLCRIASISKCVTGVAVLRLIEDGKLKLTDKLFDILPIDSCVIDVRKADPRLREITVQDLLWQRSGLEQVTHPVWASRGTAAQVGATLPMTALDLDRFALLKPLVCDPGTDYHYANANFFFLSQIVKKRAGSYANFVQMEVLASCGIRDMTTVSARLSDRKPGETRYFDLSGSKAPSVFPEDKNALRSEAYGGGGDYGAGGDMWIASVVDLAKFLRGVFYTNSVLGPQMRALISQPFPGTAPEPHYCGAAFNIERRDTPQGPIYDYGHGGEMTGACGFISGRFDGTFFILLSNASNDSKYPDELSEFPAMELIQPLQDCADKIRNWPTDDMLGQDGNN